MPRVLNERRRKFVEAYLTTGNATKAAEEAGYKTPMQEGYRLLRSADIAEAIQERVSGDPGIATREERQRFWTEIMRGEAKGVSMRDRLKASELLAKTHRDFEAIYVTEATETRTVVDFEAYTSEEIRAFRDLLAKGTKKEQQGADTDLH